MLKRKYVPKQGNADEFNSRLMQSIQRDGQIFISSTRLEGKLVLLNYRRMKPDEASQVSTFISDVFHQFVAPGYAQEGIESFMQYIQPEALQSQLRENYFALIAESDEEIIGVIGIRDFSHVALFFVADRFQRKGVGKALFRQSVEICRQHENHLAQITVNASPNAVGAYAKLGFKPTDRERCVNGIRSVPMVCDLIPGQAGS